MDLVLFDLDGTLADTLVDIAAALNVCLAARGLATHETRAIRAMIGDGVEKLVERAAPGAPPELRRELAASFRKHYDEHLVEATRPYPGIPELLAALRVPSAVFSNKPDHHTKRLVGALFPEHRFVAVEGQKSGRPAKPDPTVALAIAQGYQPERCLFVGDTRTDMETATRAGMIAAGVLWGYRDRDELLAHGARVLVERPDQLLQVIAGSAG